jgi:hypothetical protein
MVKDVGSTGESVAISPQVRSAIIATVRRALSPRHERVFHIRTVGKSLNDKF